MYKTRIVFWGTRGQELTSRHLAEFVNCGANLVGFIEAPPGSISTVHTEKDPFEGINEVAAHLKKPLLCPKNAREQGFVDQTWGQTLSKPLNEIQEIEPFREGRGECGFVVVAAARS